MPEFDRSVLDALRQPLEDGVVTVSRVSSTLTFPALCILGGAMNRCPCGFKGYPEQNCVSSPASCSRYASKISGPLLDRIDLHIDVARLKPEELLGVSQGECSSVIRDRVIAARALQHRRLGSNRVNAQMTPREIKTHVKMDKECEDFMLVVMS